MSITLSDKTESSVNGFSLKPQLRPQIAELRDAVLHQKEWQYIPNFPIIDAKSWMEHTSDEDWQLWRARKLANRLAQMPLDLLDGERLVGRPQLRAPNAEEASEIEKLKDVIETLPPHCGGDTGHFHPDFEKLFAMGLGGILDEIRTIKASSKDDEQKIFYTACEISMEATSAYVLRVADECESRAVAGTEWSELSRICKTVASEPPSTFHEAMQLLFLVTVALWFGEDHGLTCAGRIDKTLRRFYEADLAAGFITREDALELISCLYIQYNNFMGPGSAVAVIVGGRDGEGNDVTNDLTYLALQARLATKLVYPTLGIAWHENTPAELSDFACKMLSTGIGDPAFFNDELIASGLRDHDVSWEDSYNYMNSTCVEIKPVGASNIWVAAPYVNLPLGILEVMEEITTGVIPEPLDFSAFKSLVKTRISEYITRDAKMFDDAWHKREEIGCQPLASCFIDDCLERGLDFDRGGAKYNWVENSNVGLANLADGLFAIKSLVYESKEFSIAQLQDILKSDYEGQEELRQRILNNLPSYGTDNDEADALAVECAEFLQETTESHIVGLHRYVPGFFCWIIHSYFGEATGATPDGRKAGAAFADGAGAAQGREFCGPTASILSTTKWSHKKAMGGLVQNLKFSENAIATESGRQILLSMIETYLRRGGFEIQVNVVGSNTLRDAQLHPENYPDLIVRVAGYSDYFTHLNPVMQAEVIARTEHMQ